MLAVYRLTLRQLSGRWRLAIMTVLAAMPVIIAVLMLSDRSAPSVREFETAILGAMLTGRPVRFVFKEFPIFGQVSDTAARVALTAAAKSKGLDLYGRLMAEKALDEAGIEAMRLKVQQVMVAQPAEVDRMMGVPPVEPA